MTIQEIIHEFETCKLTYGEHADIAHVELQFIHKAIEILLASESLAIKTNWAMKLAGKTFRRYKKPFSKGYSELDDINAVLDIELQKFHKACGDE